MENEELKNGPQELFHKNGQLMSRCVWKDGYVVDGEVPVYDSDGKLYAKEVWKNGYCQAFFVGSNHPAREFGLFNGLLNGENKEFFQDGAIQKICFYKNGQLTGKETTFYPNGRVCETRIYDANGVADGKYMVYNKNGSIKEYNVWKNNILSVYRTNNTLRFTVPCVWGEREGILKGYDEAGNLEAELPFEKDRINGIGKRFYPNGTLMIIGNYINGSREGVHSCYDEEGNLKREIFFVNDVFDGVEKFYSEGKIVSTKMYVEGEYCGTTHYEYYKDTGTLFREVCYNGELPEGVEKSYHKNGVLYSENTFKDGMAVDGSVTIFDEDGSVQDVYEFKNNVARAYYESGALKIMCVSYRDQANGCYTRYNVDGSIDEEYYMFDGDECESKEDFLKKTFEKLANDCHEYFEKIDQEKFRNFFCNRYKEIMEGPLADKLYDNYRELTEPAPRGENEWETFFKQVSREFILRLRLPNDGKTEEDVLKGLIHLYLCA